MCVTLRMYSSLMASTQTISLPLPMMISLSTDRNKSFSIKFNLIETLSKEMCSTTQMEKNFMHNAKLIIKVTSLIKLI
jgi:uncharacterized protein (DUF302 family)